LKKILLYTSILIIGFFSFFILKEYIQISIYPIVKQYEKNKLLNSLKDYEIIDTGHFKIYFKEQERNIGEITGEIAELYYDEVCLYFNYYPKDITPIIIYEDKDELMSTVKLNGDTPPLGVYYSGTLNLLSPNLWIKGYDIEQEYKNTTPVIHEFTHLIVDEKTRGNYPLWLTEGLALFIEKETIGFEWEKGIGEISNISLKDLNDNFDEIEIGAAYRKSYEVIDKLNDQFGFDKINLLLDNLGIGSNVNTSLKRVFKLSLDDMEY